MQLGILSDTHNEFKRTERAVETLIEKGADCIVHCGDLSDPEIIEICSRLPFYFVFGNHDSDMAGRLQETADKCGTNCLGWGGEFVLDGKKIAVAHGHLTMDLKPLIEGKPDYLLTGHSHQKHDFLLGTFRRINPGALHRATSFTVAILDLSSNQLNFITIPP